MELLQNMLLVASLLLLGALGARVKSQFREIGIPALFLMIVFFMVWVAGELIELNAPTFELMLGGRNFQQIGVFLTPLCVLYFSVEYTQAKALRPLVALVAALQVMAVALIFTDGSHHLMRASVTLSNSGFFAPSLEVTSTTLGSLMVAFNFSLPLLGLVILGRFGLHVAPQLRRSLGLIMAAIFGTFVVATLRMTLLEAIGINIPIPVLNLPFVVLLSYAVAKGGFLALTPIAFTKVFEVIDQGIIIIDNSGIVVETNCRAQMILGVIAPDLPLARGEAIAPLFAAQNGFPGDAFAWDRVPGELVSPNRAMTVALAVHEFEKAGGRQMGYVLVLTDITALKRQAECDALTGAYNRAGLNNAFETLRYKQGEMAMLVIDLDNFKSINDTYGHLGGDRILKDLVATTRDLFPESMALGRLGGDEFVALVPVSLDEAAIYGEKLRFEVAKRTVAFMDAKIEYTISVGVARAQDKSVSLSDLLHQADQALYRSKQRGRNTISF